MLKCFFDINTDNKALFDGLKIMNHKDAVEKHLNKYPIISLTLKNVEESTYQQSLNKLKRLVSCIYQQNIYLYESDKLNAFIL